MTITERFAANDSGFQAHITELSAQCGKSPEAVYELWLEYCNDCRNYDQSPAMFEFESWYANQLAA